MTTAVNNYTYSPTTSNAGATTAGEMQDRFLKLLVAQINNQDPLNPMDNAQMTTQMAQINTVSGIQQLNTTMQGMTAQFTAMQVLQGAALVGRDVLTESDKLVLDDEGIGRGALDLAGPVDNVKVEILNAAGTVVDTLSAGSLPAGRHDFAWDSKDYAGTGDLKFRIVATRAGKEVEATGLVRSTVSSVGSENGIMKIQLVGRDPVAYADLKAIL